MLTYSCKIRLNDNLQNEVRKSGVTAAAIVVLRALHGGEGSVVDLEIDGETKSSDSEIRDDLVREYGARKVQETLGVSGVPLPQEIVGASRKRPPKVSDLERMTA